MMLEEEIANTIRLEKAERMRKVRQKKAFYQGMVNKLEEPGWQKAL